MPERPAANYRRPFLATVRRQRCVETAAGIDTLPLSPGDEAGIMQALPIFIRA
jgi:hypothetical protein